MADTVLKYNYGDAAPSKPADWNNAANSIECYGGAGKGGTGSKAGGYAGGGGGAYSKEVNVTWDTLTMQISAGGDEADTWVKMAGTTKVLAQAGKNAAIKVAGAGGLASAGTGSTKRNGGTGGTGATYPNGAGGGGCAGTASDGGVGGNATADAPAGAGGAGGGGEAGAGGSGGLYGYNGVDGNLAGGGGGGSTGGGTSGGAGKAGRIVITYTPTSNAQVIIISE